MRAWFLILIMMLMIGACGTSDRPPTVPHLANTSTPAPTATFTPLPSTPTLTRTPTFTPSPTPQPTFTATSTRTATPSPAPSPDIQFSADRSYIKAGMCVVFTWKVKHSQAVYFYADGEPWGDQAVSPIDNREECRTVSTWYYLRVVGLDGTVDIREIHIPVEPMPGL